MQGARAFYPTGLWNLVSAASLEEGRLIVPRKSAVKTCSWVSTGKWFTSF